ncbi:MAG: M48 family metalloprotease [Verrucomicrobia bacterium]|nr:M48 family metalloprotease [Verrucomicrobiota bacterium]
MPIIDYILPRNPVTQRRELHFIPTWVENFVGEHSYASLIADSGGELLPSDTDGKYIALVQKVGEQLAEHSLRKEFKYEFKIINSNVDNAWCLPGGKIAINLGLIKKMEAENNRFGLAAFSLEQKIAAVLSHEIIHAAARHTGRALEFRLFMMGIFKAVEIWVKYAFVTHPYEQKITQAKDKNSPLVAQLEREKNDKLQSISRLFNHASAWILRSLTLCNSRSHELESDKYGMSLMQKAMGTDAPQAAIWLQHFFHAHHPYPSGKWGRIWSFFSTHPTPQERLEENKKTWAELTKRS